MSTNVPSEQSPRTSAGLYRVALLWLALIPLMAVSMNIRLGFVVGLVCAYLACVLHRRWLGSGTARTVISRMTVAALTYVEGACSDGLLAARRGIRPLTVFLLQPRERGGLGVIGLAVVVAIISLLAVSPRGGLRERTGFGIGEDAESLKRAMSEGQLEPFERGGKWGYRTKLGSTVMPPQFDKAEKFKAGRALVYADGGYGYVTGDGTCLGKLDGRFNLDYEYLAKSAGISEERIQASAKTFAGQPSVNLTGKPGEISVAESRDMALGALIALAPIPEVDTVRVLDPTSGKMLLKRCVAESEKPVSQVAPRFHPLD